MQRGHLMQMAQRKRQHEREEASEDEEYSEEEGEEYFEEGEEEERSFDPEEEASESDDSRDWKRRSRYKHAPPPPPPPLPYTPVVSPGFWFGHTHKMDIEGPALAGRWIQARKMLWQEGKGQDSCQNLFLGRRRSQPVQASSSG